MQHNGFMIYIGDPIDGWQAKKQANKSTVQRAVVYIFLPSQRPAPCVARPWVKTGDYRDVYFDLTGNLGDIH